MSDYSTEHEVLVPAAWTSTPTLSSDYDPPSPASPPGPVHWQSSSGPSLGEAAWVLLC